MTDGDGLHQSQESSLLLHHLIVQFCLGECFCSSNPFLKREQDLQCLALLQQMHRNPLSLKLYQIDESLLGNDDLMKPMDHRQAV